jgi:D-tyrosyl-tRNA(Tyr) deacylase
LILVGIKAGDTEEDLAWMAGKCANLRIFADDAQLMNRSVVDIGGEALVVSQFTLYGDARKGNRPSFIEAAKPEIAEPQYERFCALLSEQMKRKVATGRFGAMMDVELVNDGPVTILIER